MKKNSNRDFYAGKPVLVTGGSGFIGRHIAEELLVRGACVRIPIHKHRTDLPSSRVQTKKADLTCLQDCLRVMKGVDYVFHAAGSASGVGVSGYSMMAGIVLNLNVTSQVLLAAWMSGVKKVLIFGSSTSYPAVPHPVKEDEMWKAPPHPSYFGYGWMRRYVELIAEFTARKSGVKIALVRPTAIYGDYDNFDPVSGHVIPSLIRRALRKEDPYIVWGNGRDVRDFIHARDLAKGCLLVMEKENKGQPVNIGSGVATSMKDLVHEVLKASGYVDADVRFDASKPSTIPFRVADISRAKSLGFRPRISLEQGIADTVRWYKER